VPNYPGYQPYPKALYKEEQHYGGRLEIISCVVESEVEHKNKGNLWAESPQDAKKAREALGDDISQAAAERAAADLKLSKKAQREMDAKEKKTGHHVPE
jgi:hypothetical protein